MQLVLSNMVRTRTEIHPIFLSLVCLCLLFLFSAALLLKKTNLESGITKIESKQRSIRDGRKLIFPGKCKEIMRKGREQSISVLSSPLQQYAEDEYMAKGGQWNRSVYFLQGCSSLVKEKTIQIQLFV